MKKINKRKNYILLEIVCNREYKIIRRQTRKAKKHKDKAENEKNKILQQQKNLKYIKEEVENRRFQFDNADVKDENFREVCCNFRNSAIKLKKENKTEKINRALDIENLCGKQVLDKTQDGGIAPITVLISEHINLIGNNKYSKRLISSINNKIFKNKDGWFKLIDHKVGDNISNIVENVCQMLDILKSKEEKYEESIILEFSAEALNNVVDHAYEKTSHNEKLFVSCEYRPHLISIVIYDIGKTIPHTIKSNQFYKEIFNKLNDLIGQEDILLEFAFDKDEKTRISQTKYPNRGKGLLRMVELTEKNENVKLEVYSGKASINIENGKIIDKRNYPNSLQGTLLSLKISI